MHSSASKEMTRRVAVVLEGDPIADAYRYMTTLQIHHVPVTRDGKLVGILSDRDILLHARHKGDKLVVPDVEARAVMSAVVISCGPSATIGTVADLMLKHHIHCVPVVSDEGDLEGIITSTDLIRLLRDSSWTMEDRIPFRFERPARVSALAN